MINGTLCGCTFSYKLEHGLPYDIHNLKTHQQQKYSPENAYSFCNRKLIWCFGSNMH